MSTTSEAVIVRTAKPNASRRMWSSPQSESPLRLSDVVYRKLVADANKASPQGNRGDSDIQRGRPNPDSRLFGQATSRAQRPGYASRTGDQLT
jgi:hypothetical protein